MDDNISIFIVTWNVATNSPDENMENLLNIKHFRATDAFPDFYFIGLQEVKSQPQNFVMDALFNDPWTITFTNLLSKYGYVKMKTCRLVGIVLNVFCLRKHITRIRQLYTEQTKTGLLNLWGNKGAVSMRFEISGCSICAVNSHLAPHDNFVKDRIDDYNAILQGQRFPIKDTTNIFFHDYVFWFGDLNFRLNNETILSPNAIVKKIEGGNFMELFESDQLKQVMETGEAFSELQETRPSFPPTYKFTSDNYYDFKRRPGWTDRILYRVNKDTYENVTLQAQQLAYNSCPQYTVSDHKPVVSHFIVKVFKEFEEKGVKIDPLDTWALGKENKAIITMDADFTPYGYDWIGLYKDNFGGLDEYLTYVYLNSDESVIQGNQHTVTFPDTAIRETGSYNLLYFTHTSDSVLGISKTFCVTGEYKRQPLDW